MQRSLTLYSHSLYAIIEPVFPSGSFSVSNPGCTVAVGNTHCTMPVTWNVVNAPNAGVFIDNNPNYWSGTPGTVDLVWTTVAPITLRIRKNRTNSSSLILATTQVYALQGVIPAPSSASTLTQPSGDVFDTTPTFTWSTVPNATGYTLKVINTTTSAVVINQNVTSTTYTPTIAVALANYSWTVQAYNTTGSGPISNAVTFAIIQQVVPSASITVSNPGCTVAVGATYCTMPVTWSRTNAPNAGVFIDNNTSFWSGTPGTVGLIWTTVAPITLRVRLDRNNSNSQILATKQVYATQGTAPPAPSVAPTLSAPTGSITDTTPTYSWSAVTNATGYTLKVTNTSTNSVVINQNVSTTTYTPTAAMALANYSWTAQAYNSTGTGPISNTSTFVLTSPTSNIVTPNISISSFISITGSYNVSWTSSSDATNYILEEKENSGSWVIYNLANTITQAFNHSNKNSSIYQYRVKACDSNACSGYSDIKKVILNIPQYSSTTPVASNTLPAIESGSASVGSSGGGFQTDQMGQASYSMPIYAGMGTAGLSPKVSLNYSSGSSNGPLGVGWTLSGITVITRCRETEESRDGTTTITPQPITWGTEDKLCLNGERLYVVSGSYWGNASTYRTERDQFARITYYSSNYLTVERKDGSIAYYGNTSDSNIKANVNATTPTYAWVINRFQDNMSNYIDYTYNNLPAGVNAGELEFVLTDIDYTGHLSNPTISPYNKIHFTYDGGVSGRPDTTTSFIGGAKVEMKLRLSQIESLIDNIEVRSYTLNYSISTTSSRSIIDSIMECRGSTCLPATTFEWSQSGVGFLPSTTTSFFPTNLKSSKLGDINGDGRADLIFVENGQTNFKVAFGDGKTGFSVNSTTNLSAPTDTKIDKKWHLIDFNADGRQDIMKQGLDNNWYIHYALPSTGINGVSGFDSVGVNTSIPGSVNDDFELADVNGDGLVDIIYPVGDTGLKVRYLVKNGQQYGFSTEVYSLNLPSRPQDLQNIDCVNNDCTEGNNFITLRYAFFNNGDFNIQTADVNGDGVADLILKVEIISNSVDPNPNVFSATNGDYQFHSQNNQIVKNPILLASTQTVLSKHWVAFVSNGGDVTNGLDFKTKQQYIGRIGGGEVSSSLTKIKFVDINADGLTDVLYRREESNFSSWAFRLSTGIKFDTLVDFSTVTNEDSIQIFDYNNDGYLDIVSPFNDSFQNHPYYVKTWNGTTFGSWNVTGEKAYDLATNVNFFLDLNGDGREDHFRIGSDAKQNISIRKNSYTPVDKIITFTNGLGASTRVYYEPLSFSSVYNQGSGANQLNYGHGSPVFDFMGSMYVVRSVVTDAPTEIDANNTTGIYYRYADGRIQSGGRGFLGFGTITTSVPVNATNDTSSYILETQSTYYQNFPFIGLPESVSVTQYESVFTYPTNNCDASTTECFPVPCYPSSNCPDPIGGTTSPTLLSQTINTVKSTPTVGNSVFAYIDSTTEQTFDPFTINGSLLKTRTQSTTHDAYGNPVNNTIKIYKGTDTAVNLMHTITTVNGYTNNSSSWKIGLLESTSTSVVRPTQAPVNTLIEYDYLANGLLSEERRMPTDGLDKFLRIRHKYDKFGNEVKTISCSKGLTVSQCDATSSMQSANISNPTLVHRYNEIIFDTKGRYANKVKNSLAQTVSNVTSRDIYGNPLTSIDLLGTTITNTYNTFGANETSYSSLGTWTYSSNRWCTNISGTSAITCPSNAKVRVTNKTQGGAVSYSFIDKLGRTVTTTEQSFNETNLGSTTGDDRWVINKQFYDALGRSYKKQGPYFYGASYIPTTLTEFDRYNRPTKVILPDASTESISYSGFTTITTNALNQTKTEIKNALGELIEVRDYIGGKLNYTYNSQGLASKIRRTADGIVELLIDNTYDKAGRKTISRSVDTGTSTTDYNAEGEIISVRDNKGQTVDTYRDTLGRVYLTETFDGSNAKKTSYTYSYDASTNLLLNEKDLMSAEAYQKYYFYDNLNRIKFASIVIDDTESVCNQGGICNFTNYNYYDQYSRKVIQQDASGKAVENLYNLKGYLKSVRDKNNTAKEYYNTLETDARGNVTMDRKSASLYTDYTYDIDRGFMKGIQSAAVGTNQSYEYDVLGNIKKRTDGSNSECFVYDGLNRMTATHRSSGSSCSSTTGNQENTLMTYDGRGNITQKDGQTYSYNNAMVNAIGNSPHQVRSKGSQSFSYDANGNNTSMTLFNSPEHGLITRNIEYTTFDKIEHAYLGSISNPTEEAFYKYDTSNNRYARVDINSTGEKKVTFFIGNTEIEYSSNGQLKYKRQLGNFAIIEEFNGNSTDRYLFTDHLGSVDKITDASGNLIQAMSFSAWGERRLPSNWSNTLPLTTLQQLNDYTNSGFTGHEMVDAFGIINVGGRIYDAALGRMLQADPFVQDPTNTQSFNRYTYVFNNPLSYTDPSGYFSLRQTLGIVVGLALSIFTPFSVGVFWNAFIAGFASSIIITGNLKTALKAGLVAGAIAFVGDKLFPAKEDIGTNETAKKVKGGNGDIKPDNLKSPDTNLNTVSKKVVKNTLELNDPGTIVKIIKETDDLVTLSTITATPAYDLSGKLINFSKYYIDRSAITTGLITGGITSLLIDKWASEFANHIVDNLPKIQKLKLESTQSKLDDFVAKDLRVEALRINKLERTILSQATQQKWILAGMLSPFAFETTLTAGGFVSRTSYNGLKFSRDLIQNISAELKADIFLGTADLLGYAGNMNATIESFLLRQSISEGIVIEIERKAQIALIREVGRSVTIRTIIK